MQDYGISRASATRFLFGPGEKFRFSFTFFVYYIGMRRGQTMVEYILVFLMLLIAVYASKYLIQSINRQAARTEFLIGSGYP